MPDGQKQTLAKIARFVGRQGEDLAHPGIGPIRMEGKEPVYHKYYQVTSALLDKEVQGDPIFLTTGH